MSNRFINELLIDYEKKKSLAEEAAKERRQVLYKKIPRIKEIDSEISVMGMDIARSIFTKDVHIEDYIEKLHHKHKELKLERQSILSKFNCPLDFDEPKYSCSDCSDTGYIGFEKCHCLKQRLIDRFYRQSNLMDVLDRENFDTFIFDYYSVHKFGEELLSPRKNIENIYAACVEFVRDFDTSGENLFFYGNSGLGKTFLSNCIAKDLLDKGKLVIYQTSSDLMDILKETKFGGSSEDAAGKLKNILECDLLIIDDLGTEYITDFSQMELYNCLNKRLITGKKILASTNLSLENIYNTYPERITSRIFGNFTMFKFYGEDIRIKIGQQKRRKSRKA